MNHSKVLKNLLNASSMSQEELAQKLGVSFVTLNSWINNRSQPRKKALENIKVLSAELLGSESIDLTNLNSTKEIAQSHALTCVSLRRGQAIFDTLALHLTYNTNTIEGSTMTLADTEAVLFEHAVLSNRTQSEQLESTNHQAALQWLVGRLQHSAAIDEQLILDIHLRLMNGLIGDAGAYRKHNVRIMGSFVATANSVKVPELMKSLVAEIDQKQKDKIAHMAKVHASFEKIHPFSDGNGRLGRLLMIAMALNYGIMPPIISRQRKFAYYKYLQIAQSKQVFEPLELFVAESIIYTASLLKPR